MPNNTPPEYYLSYSFEQKSLNFKNSYSLDMPQNYSKSRDIKITKRARSCSPVFNIHRDNSKQTRL